MPTMVLPKSNDPCWCGSGKKFKRCHKDVGPTTATRPGVRLVEPGRVSPVRTVPAEIPRPDYVATTASRAAPTHRS